MPTNYIEAPAAALGKDIPADYVITVNGKKIRTTGTVQSVRRVGEFEIEITLKHRRTGEIHTNRMDARATVYVWAIFLQDGYTAEVQQGLPREGIAEIWTESLVDQLRATLKDNMWNFAGMPIEA
jgi:hypothetical protein